MSKKKESKSVCEKCGSSQEWVGANDSKTANECKFCIIKKTTMKFISDLQSAQEATRKHNTYFGPLEPKDPNVIVIKREPIENESNTEFRIYVLQLKLVSQSLYTTEKLIRDNLKSFNKDKDEVHQNLMAKMFEYQFKLEELIKKFYYTKQQFYYSSDIDDYIPH